jgi:hypothetical protein
MWMSMTSWPPIVCLVLFTELLLPPLSYLCSGTLIHSEMGFLASNLTKDSNLLLHAIRSPFYCRILKKTILFSGFQDPYKKSAKQENSNLFMNSIWLNRNGG